MALTDSLRAEVFARDRAICAFSGLSVWILDYGASPVFQYDWADHALPKARGGRDEVENLVCASAFYNSKKRANGADNFYLFRNGRPTEYFFWNHPKLSADQADVLASHERILATDWHFNRALAQINQKLWQYYCGTRNGWTRKIIPAAIRHLTDWRRKGGINDFRKRGLVRHPRSPDVRLMLELADIPAAVRPARLKREIGAVYARLKPYFVENGRALERFVAAQSPEGRRQVYRRALANEHVTRPLIVSLKSNLGYLQARGGPTAEFIRG